jgi:hypothetical protein
MAVPVTGDVAEVRVDQTELARQLVLRGEEVGTPATTADQSSGRSPRPTPNTFPVLAKSGKKSR